MAADKPDLSLFEHIVKTTHSFFADGFVQKSLKFLKVALPNIAVVGRDSCHLQRIATGDPLKRDAIMGLRFQSIMGGQGALFPTIQASDKWRAELQSAQHFLKKHGKTGLSTILRQMGHADARYESSASCSRHFVALQGPIALTLAIRTQDTRLEVEKRKQAAEWLSSMGPACAVEAGLMADWSSEALRYIRQDDKADPDPALLLQNKDTFIERIDKLFVQGRIILEAPDDDSTYTSMSIRNAKECPPIFYGTKVAHLWCDSLANNACVSSLLQMKKVASDTIERLNVEFGPHVLLCDFACFCLAAWQGALNKKCPVAIGNLQRHFRRLLEARGINVLNSKRQCDKEIRGAAEVLLSSFPNHLEMDNREVWGHVAAPGFAERCGVKTFHYLDLAVCWYVGIEHSTSSCERGLGVAKRVANTHSGPLSDLCNILHAIIDGPKDRTEVADELEPGNFGLTEASRLWAQLWIENHGRRFMSYVRRFGPEPPRKAQLGTDASLKREQCRATDALVEMSTRKAKRAKSIMPIEPGQVAGAVEDTKETLNFRKHTQRRQEELRRNSKETEPKLTEPRTATLLSNSNERSFQRIDDFPKAGLLKNVFCMVVELTISWHKRN